MRQGTTPTHSFTLPVSSSSVGEIYVSYNQNNSSLIEKSGDDISFTDMEDGSCVASVTLSQTETLKLSPDSDCLIQIRFRTSTGAAFASQIISERVEKVLKGGEI